MSYVAVNPSLSDGSATLLVLLLASCFHIMEGIGQNQRRRACFAPVGRQTTSFGRDPQVAAPGRSLSSFTVSCLRDDTHSPFDKTPP